MKLIALTLAATLLIGCASSPVMMLAERRAVQEAVVAYIGGDQGKALRVSALAQEVLIILDGDPTATVGTIEAVVRSRIPWDDLRPIDRRDLDDMITIAARALEERVAARELDADKLLPARVFFRWVLDAADLHFAI